MKEVLIKAKNEYHYVLGSLENVGKEIAKILSCDKVFIVSDDNVASLYLNDVHTSLESEGFKVFDFVFQAGETSKNPSTLIELLEALSKEGMSSGDAIIALGGGSVGDLAGLAAGLYHRGIPYIQVPTTLLAAVDSSVGGKTAVDLAFEKNAIGMIYQPKLVYFDLNTIFSLPASELKSGFGEVAKYELISGKKAGEVINEEFILFCIQAKAYFIAEDEYDKGNRAILNLGHTAAHAIESCSHYEISHGQAVAMGLYIETKGSYAIGNRYADAMAAKVLETLDAFELPHACPYTADELFEAALADKKRNDATLRFPMLTNYGKCEIKEISLDELKKVFVEGLA